MEARQIAEAFSGHRFAEAYPYLSPDVVWVLPGQDGLEGKQAVVAACDHTLAELEGTTTEFLRFVAVGDDRVAACDTLTSYTGPDGSVTRVASADVYELGDDGLVARITSYAVEA